MSPARVEPSVYALRKARKQLRELCASIADPNDMSERASGRLQKAVDRLHGLTGSVATVLRVMEQGNPAFNRGGLTPEQVERAVQEAQKTATQARRPSPNEGHPFLDANPLYRELAQSMLQTAALTGETIVVRTTIGQVKESGMPTHLIPVNSRLPAYPVR